MPVSTPATGIQLRPLESSGKDDRFAVMRLFLLFTLSTVVGQTGAVSIPDTWTRRAKPFRIIENVHYVGTVDLASYLITGTEGHVLVDTGLEQNADAVMDAIRQLGFNLRDVRIILT